MKAKVTLTRTEAGKTLSITADCDNTQEIGELLSSVVDHIPRRKIFGLF